MNLAQKADISVFGVIKATCGDPAIAQAMLRGGVCGIADSRLENIRTLKQNKIQTTLMHLRTPMISEVDTLIEYADISLNTETTVLNAISNSAAKKSVRQKIILMVEMGDLREGMLPDHLDYTIEKIQNLPHIDLYGIGMNLACFGGVVPTKEKIEQFCNLVEKLERQHDIRFEMISGGNSANIPLLLKCPMETKINNLRIGEGILLGRETVHRTPIPDTYQDAFILEAEIIEYKQKPSKPYGSVTQNAFGEMPKFKDIGIINRAIVAIGKQDTIPKDLTPLDKNIKILGSSSDHIILHITTNDYTVGDILQFQPKYGALVHLYTSKYVEKKYLN